MFQTNYSSDRLLSCLVGRGQMSALSGAFDGWSYNDVFRWKHPVLGLANAVFRSVALRRGMAVRTHLFAKI